MHLPFRLDGRQALVTGGASGIGAATCRALHGAGAQVTIADIDRPGAETLSRELSGSPILILDITDETAVAAAFRAIGALDILVNCAGVGLVGGGWGGLGAGLGFGVGFSGGGGEGEGGGGA